MLDVAFLVDVVERDDLIANEPSCWHLVNRAKNYHLLPQRMTSSSNGSKACSPTNTVANPVSTASVTITPSNPLGNMTGSLLASSMASAATGTGPRQQTTEMNSIQVRIRTK